MVVKTVVVCKNCHADIHHGDVKVDESMLCNVSENLEIIRG